MRAWRLYTRVLASHPRTTNICTAGIVSALADVAAQRIEYHHHKPTAVTLASPTSAVTIVAASPLIATPTLASTIGVTDTVTTTPLPLLDTTNDAASPIASTSLVATDTDTNANASTSSSSLASIVSHDGIWLPDGNRLACMTLFGSLMGGVAFYHWYRWLDATFPGRTPIAVAKKVLLNLVTAAPANNSAFYGWILATDQTRAKNHTSKPLMCMDGITPATRFMDQWMSKLRADLPKTTLASFSFWGPIQMINFAFVPPQYRVLYQSGGVFTWTCWVNLVGHR